MPRNFTCSLLLALSCLPVSLAFAGTQAVTSKKAPSRQPVGINLLALIKQHNAQLLKDRQHIEDIAQHYLQNDDISEADFNWLKNTAADYQMEPRQRGDQTFFKDLLVRVDVVPPSLVLAQALLESGTDASRRQGNNFFGIRCTADCGQGKRDLMAFATPDAAVAYYFKLLNTAKPYQPFRELRAQARSKQQKLRGNQLANGLGKYSPQGKLYIQKIKTTISNNQLAKLD